MSGTGVSDVSERRLIGCKHRGVWTRGLLVTLPREACTIICMLGTSAAGRAQEKKTPLRKKRLRSNSQIFRFLRVRCESGAFVYSGLYEGVHDCKQQQEQMKQRGISFHSLDTVSFSRETATEIKATSYQLAN